MQTLTAQDAEEKIAEIKGLLKDLRLARDSLQEAWRRLSKALCGDPYRFGDNSSSDPDFDIYQEDAAKLFSSFFDIKKENGSSYKKPRDFKIDIETIKQLICENVIAPDFQIDIETIKRLIRENLTADGTYNYFDDEIAQTTRNALAAGVAIGYARATAEAAIPW